MAKVSIHAIELRHLRYFVAIVDAGSFSRAAAAIHVFVERPGRRWLRARLAPQRADPVEAQRSVHSDQGEPF